MGFVLHEVHAYINNEKAGYLKISYVPRQNYQKIYKTGMDYARKCHGWCCGLGDNTDRDVLQQAAWYCFLDNDLNEKIKTMSAEELNDVFQMVEEHISKNLSEQIRKFKRFHINKPLVDSIQVFLPFRRQGIGTALYLEGARWMKEKDMFLHASGLQSESAEKCWDKFLKLGLAKSKSGRIILDPI